MNHQERAEGADSTRLLHSPSCIVVHASPQCQYLIPVCVSSYFRFAEVKQKLENTTSKYVLVKDATLRPPDQQLKQNTPSGYRHVFFIRDPTLVYHSYHKGMYSKLQTNGLLDSDLMDESEFDIEKHDAALKGHNFFKYLHELWGHVRENIDPNSDCDQYTRLARKP